MGLALAKRCLETGARVTIVGRDEARLAGARQALGNPATLHVFAADITREDQVGNLFASLTRLDHIVSTAADIAGAYELLPSLDLRAAQRVVESKLFVPLLLAKHGAETVVVWLHHLHLGYRCLSASSPRFGGRCRQRGA